MLLLTLSGCVTSGNKAPGYPVLPADLKVCFNTQVPAPKAGSLSKAQVIQLISALKKSEAEKTECGRRLIGFYESLSHPN